jgi:hypothetical protein
MPVEQPASLLNYLFVTNIVRVQWWYAPNTASRMCTLWEYSGGTPPTLPPGCGRCESTVVGGTRQLCLQDVDVVRAQWWYAPTLPPGCGRCESTVVVRPNSASRMWTVATPSCQPHAYRNGRARHPLVWRLAVLLIFLPSLGTTENAGEVHRTPAHSSLYKACNWHI